MRRGTVHHLVADASRRSSQVQNPSRWLGELIDKDQLNRNREQTRTSTYLLTKSEVDNKEIARIIEGIPIDRTRTSGFGFNDERYSAKYHDYVLAHDDRF